MRLLLTLMTLTVGSMIVRADVMQSTVILPPPAGQYFVPVICVTTGCTVNAILDSFIVNSSAESAGNQLEVVGTRYRSDVYTNSGGSPGIFLGSVSLLGTMNLTYFGRDPSVNPLGTFNAQITNFDFLGVLNGNSFEVRQNPGLASTGMTTINEVSISPVIYDVSSTFAINAEISINGGPFLDAPTQTTTLMPAAAAVPEPSYMGFAGLMLLLVFGFGRRQSQTR